MSLCCTATTPHCCRCVRGVCNALSVLDWSMWCVVGARGEYAAHCRCSSGVCMWRVVGARGEYIDTLSMPPAGARGEYVVRCRCGRGVCDASTVRGRSMRRVVGWREEYATRCPCAREVCDALSSATQTVFPPLRRHITFSCYLPYSAGSPTSPTSLALQLHSDHLPRLLRTHKSRQHCTQCTHRSRKQWTHFTRDTHSKVETSHANNVSSGPAGRNAECHVLSPPTS